MFLTIVMTISFKTFKSKHLIKVSKYLRTKKNYMLNYLSFFFFFLEQESRPPLFRPPTRDNQNKLQTNEKNIGLRQSP